MTILRIFLLFCIFSAIFLLFFRYYLVITTNLIIFCNYSPLVFYSFMFNICFYTAETIKFDHFDRVLIIDNCKFDQHDTSLMYLGRCLTHFIKFVIPSTEFNSLRLLSLAGCGNFFLFVFFQYP